MTSDPEQASPAQRARGAPNLLLWFKRNPRAALVSAIIIVIVWVALPLAPAETGLRFGLGFQVFFTVSLVLSAVFFWFLGQERIPYPHSALGVFASIAGVYLATVGLLIAIGMVSPQFGLPQVSEEGVQLEAAKRGEALFSKAEVGCFLCHAVAGRGGTRGPDLTQVAARAGNRVPGLSAEHYLLEKIKAGATYQFNVPEYVPMMPPFGQTLSE